MIVNVSDIKINNNRRAVDISKVKELADSIKEIGLINPITVTTENILIAGAHRLEAYKLLERTEIEATICNFTGLYAELAEIDENVIRNELHYSDRGKQFSRRKKIYEELYPEIKHGGDRKSEEIKMRNPQLETKSFAEDTSSKTGVSSRVIYEEIQIAENLTPEAEETTKKVDLSKTEALKLCRMSAEEQNALLPYIEQGSTIEQAKKDKKQEEKIAVRENEIQRQKGIATELPNGKYNCIVIDPPWNYGTKYNPEGRRVANPYPEMTQDELKELKILSADDCIMFLWTTQKYIWNAKELLDYWGFEYRSIIVWDKEKMGMGDFLRMQCEFCLVGVKGKPILNNTHDIRDIIREPRREHSRKPETFYDIVEKLCVGKKIEYFSRSARKDWEAFGNDTDKFRLG